MKNNKTLLIIIVVAIVLIIIGFIMYAIFAKKTIPGHGTTVVNNPGVLPIITGWFNSIDWGHLFGGGGSDYATSLDNPTNCVNGCDQGNPGFDCNGFLDTNCGG